MILQKDLIRKFLFFIYLCMFMSFNNKNAMDDCFRWGSFFLLFTYSLIEDFALGNYKIYLSTHTKWVLLFSMYILLSSLWALDINDALNRPYILSFLQIIVISYVLSKWVKTQDDAIFYLKLYELSICFMIIVLVLNTPINMYGTVRLGNIIGLNSNDFGMRCSSGALIGLYFSQKKKNYYFFSLLCIVFGLLSGSRKAFFILVTGYSIFFLLKNRDIRIFRNLFIFILMVFILYKVVMKIPVFYNTIGFRIEVFLESFGGNRGDNSIVLRKFYREKAFSMFIEKPVLGWGANSFVTTLRNSGAKVVTYSHNNYTELLCTLGLIGFLIYYSLQFKILFSSLMRYIKIGKIELLLIFVVVLVNLISEYYYVSFYTIATNLQVLLLFLLLKAVNKNELRGINENYSKTF